MYIRGAYFVGTSSTNNKLIDFFILDPNNRVIYSRRRKEEGIFRLNTTMAGTYTFVFSNMKVISKGIISYRIKQVSKMLLLPFTLQAMTLRTKKPKLNKGLTAWLNRLQMIFLLKSIWKKSNLVWDKSIKMYDTFKPKLSSQASDNKHIMNLLLIANLITSTWLS